MEEFSASLKISKGYYNQIENGFRGVNLSVRMLIYLADSLEIDLATAIYEEKSFIEDLDRANSRVKGI